MAKTTWGSNFGRSVKFGAIEVAKGMTPGISKMLENNQEYLTNVIDTLNELKTGQIKLNTAFEKSAPELQKTINSVNDAVNTGWKNLKHFAKTGEAVGPHQMSGSDEEDAIGNLDNLNLDDLESDAKDAELFNFDDLPSPEEAMAQGKDSTDEAVVASAKGQIEAQTGTTRAVVQTGKLTAAAIVRNTNATQAQTAVVTKQMQANAKSALKQTSALLAGQEKFASATQEQLQMINDNIVNLINFNNDTNVKYTMAAMKYFEESLAEFKIISGILNRVYPEDQPGGRPGEERESDYDAVFGGGFNLEKYVDVVKQNFAKTEAGQALNTVLSEEFLQEFVANPVNTVMTMALSSAVPTLAKTAMEEFDQVVTGFIPAFVGKLGTLANSPDANPILKFIGEVLGIQAPKYGANLGDYEKGAVPFDGITHRTINQVIPTYLAKILAALTGGEEHYYNHEIGQFETMSDIRDRDKMIDKRIRNMAFDDIGYALDESIKDIIFENEKQRRIFKEAIDGFKDAAVRSGQFLNWNDSNQMTDIMREVSVEGMTEDQRSAMQDWIQKVITKQSKSKQIAASMAAYEYAREKNRNIQNAMKAGDLSTWIANSGFTDIDSAEEVNAANRRWAEAGYRPAVGGPGIAPIPVMSKTTKQGGGLFGRDRYLHEYQFLPPPQDERPEAPRYTGSYARDAEEYRRRLDEQMLNESEGVTNEDYDRLYREGHATFEDLIVSGADRAMEIQKEYLKEQKARAQKLGADPKALGLPTSNGPYDPYMDDDYFADDDETRRRRQGKMTAIELAKDRLVDQPTQLFAQGIGTINEILYRVLFGRNDDEEGVVTILTENISSLFSNVKNWLGKEIFTPLKEYFFGDDWKQTKFYKSMSEFFTNIADAFRGEKDAEGNYKGGFGSDMLNEFSDIGKEAKHVFSGKGYTDSQGREHPENPNSILGEMKKVFNYLWTTLKDYIFGPSTKKDEEKATEDWARQFMKDVNTGHAATGGRIVYPGSYILSEGEKVIQGHFATGTVPHTGLYDLKPGDKVLPAGGGAPSDIEKSQASEANFMFKVLGKTYGGIQSGLGKITSSIHDLGGTIVSQFQGDRATPGLTQEVRKLNLTLAGKEGEVDKIDRIQELVDSIVGAENAPGRRKPMIDVIMDKVMNAAASFTGALGGATHFDNKHINQEYMKEIRKKAPKAIARGLVGGGAVAGINALGGFGLLGSFLLPGGFIPTVLLGTGISILHQNEKFMTMMYGKKDEETGEREGGIISKKFQDFVSKNKIPILGGALFGVTKGLIFSGAGIVPGAATAVLGTAVIGAGVGLALKSEKFQQMMFGTGNPEDGKKATGMLNGAMAKRIKAVLPNAIVGAGLGAVATGAFGALPALGILGSIGIPAWAGALAGGAIGIGLASNKFRDAMFGKYDEKTGKFVSGGLVDTMKNAIRVEVIKPLAVFTEKSFARAQHFLMTDVMYPLARSFYPYKALAEKIVKDGGQLIKDILTRTGDNISALFNTILSPLKKLAKTAWDTTWGLTKSMLNVATSIGGTFMSLPFKAIGLSSDVIANRFKGTDYEEAIESGRAKAKAIKEDADFKFKERMDELNFREKDYKDERKFYRKRGYQDTEEQLAEKTAEYHAELERIAELEAKAEAEAAMRRETAEKQREELKDLLRETNLRIDAINPYGKVRLIHNKTNRVMANTFDASDHEVGSIIESRLPTVGKEKAPKTEVVSLENYRQSRWERLKSKFRRSSSVPSPAPAELPAATPSAGPSIPMAVAAPVAAATTVAAPAAPEPEVAVAEPTSGPRFNITKAFSRFIGPRKSKVFFRKMSHDDSEITDFGANQQIAEDVHNLVEGTLARDVAIPQISVPNASYSESQAVPANIEAGSKATGGHRANLPPVFRGMHLPAAMNPTEQLLARLIEIEVDSLNVARWSAGMQESKFTMLVDASVQGAAATKQNHRSLMDRFIGGIVNSGAVELGKQLWENFQMANSITSKFGFDMEKQATAWGKTKAYRFGERLDDKIRNKWQDEDSRPRKLWKFLQDQLGVDFYNDLEPDYYEEEEESDEVVEAIEVMTDKIIALDSKLDTLNTTLTTGFRDVVDAINGASGSTGGSGGQSALLQGGSGNDVSDWIDRKLSSGGDWVEEKLSNGIIRLIDGIDRLCGFGERLTSFGDDNPLISGFNTISNKLDQLYSGLTSILGQTVDTLRDFASDASANAIELKDWVSDKLSGGVAGAKGAIADFGQFATEKLGAAKNTIMEKAQSIKDKFGQRTADVIIAERKEDSFRTRLLDLLSELKGDTREAKEESGGFFDWIKKFLGNSFLTSLGLLGLLNAIGKMIKDGFDAHVRQMFSDVGTILVDRLGKFVKGVGAEIIDGLKNIGHKISRVGTFIKDEIANVIKSALGITDDAAKTGAQGGKRTITGFLKDKGKNLLDRAKYGFHLGTGELGEAAEAVKSGEERMLQTMEERAAAEGKLANNAVKAEEAKKLAEEAHANYERMRHATGMNYTEQELHRARMADWNAKAEAGRLSNINQGLEANVERSKAGANAIVAETDDAAKTLMEKGNGHSFEEIENKQTSGVIEKFTKMLGEFVAWIKESSVIKGFMGEEGTNKLATKMGKIIRFLTPEILIKYAPKIVKRLAAVGVKMAGIMAGPLGWLVTGAMVSLDVRRGYQDAAEYFGVNPEDCTGGMKTTLIVFDVICGLNIYPALFDLALEIVESAGGNLGVAPKSWLIQAIYECVPGSMDSAQLDALQAKSKAEYEEWKKKDGNASKNYHDFINEKKEYDSPVLDFMREHDPFGIATWLFGENDANGNYQKGAFARADEYLFGSDTPDENGHLKKGFFRETYDNMMNYVFGTKNEETGEPEGGLLESVWNTLGDLRKWVSEKWTKFTTLAGTFLHWLFSDDEYKESEEGKNLSQIFTHDLWFSDQPITINGAQFATMGLVPYLVTSVTEGWENLKKSVSDTWNETTDDIIKWVKDVTGWNDAKERSDKMQEDMRRLHSGEATWDMLFAEKGLTIGDTQVVDQGALYPITSGFQQLGSDIGDLWDRGRRRILMFVDGMFGFDHEMDEKDQDIMQNGVFGPISDTIYKLGTTIREKAEDLVYTATKWIFGEDEEGATGTLGEGGEMKEPRKSIPERIFGFIDDTVESIRNFFFGGPETIDGETGEVISPAQPGLLKSLGLHIPENFWDITEMLFGADLGSFDDSKGDKKYGIGPKLVEYITIHAIGGKSYITGEEVAFKDSLAGEIVAGLGGAWKSIRKGAEELGDRISKGITDFGDWVNKGLEDFGHWWWGDTEEYGGKMAPRRALESGLSTIGDGIRAVVTPISEGIQSFVKWWTEGPPLTERIANLANEIGETIEQRRTELVDWIGQTIDDVRHWVLGDTEEYGYRNFLIRGLYHISDGLSVVAKTIGNELDYAINTLLPKFVGAVTYPIRAPGEFLYNIFSGLFESASHFSGLGDAIAKTWAESTAEDEPEGAPGGSGGESALLQGGYQFGGSGMFEDMIDSASEKLSSAADSIRNTVNNLGLPTLDTIKDGVMGAIDAIVTEGIPGAMRKLIETIPDIIMKPIETFAETVRGSFENALNTIVDWVFGSVPTDEKILPELLTTGINDFAENFFGNIRDNFAKGLELVTSWVFGGIPERAHLVFDILNKGLTTVFDKFVSFTEKNLTDKWKEISTWLFDKNNLSKDGVLGAFKAGLVAAAAKLGAPGGSGWVSSFFGGSGGDSDLINDLYGGSGVDQKDPRWGNKPIAPGKPGAGLMKDKGCAITAGKTALDAAGINVSVDKARSSVNSSNLAKGPEGGITGKYMKDLARNSGAKFNEIDPTNKASVLKALDDKKTLVTGNKSTPAGHYGNIEGHFKINGKDYTRYKDNGKSSIQPVDKVLAYTTAPRSPRVLGFMSKASGESYGGSGPMYIEQQGDIDCTATSAEAMYRAYLDQNPELSINNWWANISSDMGMKEVAIDGNNPSDFEAALNKHFAEHPDRPIMLYQGRGAGKHGGHPINRGGGVHATVIGRKLDDGKYEHYDPNGAEVRRFTAHEMFDPTSHGDADNGISGGNDLYIPTIEPTSPITFGQEGKTADAGAAAASSAGGIAGALASAAGATQGGGLKKLVEFGAIATGVFGEALNQILEGEAKTIDWTKYRPGASAGTTAVGGGVTGGKSADGLSGESFDVTWKYLTERTGLTPAQAAGIMGNLGCESGINPMRVEDGFNHPRTEDIDKIYWATDPDDACPPGYGIAQWTWGSRQIGLNEYAASKGKRVSDLATQLEYLTGEGGPGGRSETSLAAVRNTTTPEDAADAWEDAYENPQPGSSAARRSEARRIYESMGYGGSGGESDLLALPDIRDAIHAPEDVPAPLELLGFKHTDQIVNAPNNTFGLTEMISAIRSLDIKQEVREMIKYLKKIAENGGTSNEIYVSGGSGGSPSAPNGTFSTPRPYNDNPGAPSAADKAVNDSKANPGGRTNLKSVRTKNLAIASGGKRRNA